MVDEGNESKKSCESPGAAAIRHDERSCFRMSGFGDEVAQYMEAQVQLPLNEEMRPGMAARIVKTVQSLDANVTISNRNSRNAMNAESIMSLLTLDAGPESVLTLHAEGIDADQAVLAIRETMAATSALREY